ncbi:hypothetical protein N177_1065 [Lutibaculum baratangense AMV1]|uniref:cAMP-binding protein n=2 Tax=Lutibaculum TaxID=1358438 RepID=V4RJD0_9HYPH|nr:Crp/Fnr family transcriptional regulator [Lutibaculum baratangense]ESR26206.1 hypothetical protein N177_1065 [Lutibaculum baratangense AMV1]
MTQTGFFSPHAGLAHSTSAQPSRRADGNLLIQSLPEDIRAALRPTLRTRSFQPGQILREAERPLASVLFVESGLIALLGTDGHEAQVEVATVGNEGLIGVSNVLGRPSAEHAAQALSSCTVRAIDAPVFGTLLNENPRFRLAMMAYAHQRMEQLIRLSVCNARHRLEQRLARWILAAAARLGPEKIVITHRDLARLLGVRRASVTEAMHLLEGHGAIRSHRGFLTLRDEEKLASLSCGCHVVAAGSRHPL